MGVKYRGRTIDWFSLWSQYVDGLNAEEQGNFHSLVMCPNPDHPNSRSAAFQLNISSPYVHCFSGCGISGHYEHALCIVTGIYDDLKVTAEDIEKAKQPQQLGEPLQVRDSRRKVRKARRIASKIIFKHSRIGAVGTALDKKAVRRYKARTEAKVEPKDLEGELINYTYFPKEAIKYLESRGIDASTRSQWQLGFDEEAKRITIPVRDERNRVAFIIRRGIHSWQKPKYLYPDESERNALLFGACVLDKAVVASQGLILVEGSLDAIRLYQHGYRNVVALLGSSLSKQQREAIARLRPSKIYLFFDKDSPGIKALQKVGKQLELKYQVRVPLYPKGQDLDPAKLSSEQVGRAIKKSITFLAMKKKVAKKKKEGFVAVG